MYHEVGKEIRWFKKKVKMLTSKNPLIGIDKEIEVAVLQQKWFDGDDKPYWKDVPTVNEESE